MKLAVQVQYDDRFERTLESVSKAGYQFISMGLGLETAIEYMARDTWEQDVLRIEQLLRKNHLQCIQTHLPVYDLRVSSEILDEEIERAMRRVVITAGRLGAEWNAYHCRTAVNENYSPRISIQHNKVALEELVELAERNNTGIAVENIPLFPEIYWMRFLGSDVEDLCQICDDFDSKAIAICWDFGHAHLMKHDEVKLIQTAGSRIQATHVHDNYQIWDDHAPPGVGNVDWPAVMGALKQTGYDGYIMQELNYCADHRLDSFMRHSYECGVYLESLLRE